MIRGQGVSLALGGLVALAAAMGIGRFLFTPALPMMAAGTGLSPGAAGLVAGANFAGYLAGALLAAHPALGAAPRKTLLAALAVSAATTAGMAAGALPLAWGLLRFAGGVASAFVLVTASALVVRRLGALGRPGLASVHFAGVGAGICLSAVIAAPLLAGPADWTWVWLAGGILSALAVPVVMRLVPEGTVSVPPAAGARAESAGIGRLAFAYGCLGFGYVVTATFIIAILREGEGSRAAETWVWLAVGLAAVPSVALWNMAARRIGAVPAFRAAMLVEAAGVALSALSGGVLALAIAAVALGGTFMALTALGLQEAARRAGGDGRLVMGLMTASFGTGQMIGPVTAGWMREATGSYAAPSLLAAAVLLVGAVTVASRR